MRRLRMCCLASTGDEVEKPLCWSGPCNLMEQIHNQGNAVDLRENVSEVDTPVVVSIEFPSPNLER